MSKVLLPTVGDFKKLIGQEVGVSDWVSVSQEDVNLFGQATGDHQWIHTDPERARAESQYGGTIAHGYFTLSLLPRLRAEIVDVEKKRMTINYGLNKLRFPAAVPVGSRVRLRARLDAVDEVKGGVQTIFSMTFEVEGQEKPACVAEAIFRYLE